MIEQLSGLPAHTFGVKLSGKLHDEDYKTLVPLVDAEIAKEGKINILAQRGRRLLRQAHAPSPQAWRVPISPRSPNRHQPLRHRD